MPPDPVDAPNRLPWPPLIYAGAILAGLALEWWMPGRLPLPGWPGWIGVGAGLLLDAAAMLTMARARTNILPHRAADRLVTAGPFGLTRNPIYLGNTLVVLGGGIVLSSPWLVAAAVAAAVLVDRLAIRREEAHLAARFGEAFRAYEARVPRWIGLPRPAKRRLRD